MATLGTTFGLIALAMGGKKEAKEQGPSINAGSKEEEAFIQFVPSRSYRAYAVTEFVRREFLKNNGGEQKAKQ